MDRSDIEDTRGSAVDISSPLDFIAPETDFNALSTQVQDIARRVNQEFELILESHGSVVVERLLPIVVSVLEKLDELYKDQAAYKVEVLHLREDNNSLIGEVEKERCARRESENRLMSIEDQFEDERKTLSDALIQNEVQLRQLEMKATNAEEQLARLELKDVESSRENSKLHERINELLRSHAELNDSLKCTIPSSTPLKIAPPANRVLGNAFDTTGAGLGFDELSALEGEMSPPGDEELLPDELSLPTGQTSDTEGGAFDFAGMQKEVNVLIRENMELVETKHALNVVKDDLLNQRDVLKADNCMLRQAVQQLTEKQSLLQHELLNSDQLLTATRTQMESLKATVSKLKAERDDKSSNKRFTKTEMARLISDRNHYKERFLELQEAIKLTETLRASQRGHPELLRDLPPAVTDIQLEGRHHQHSSDGVKGAFARLMNLISLPRLDFGFDAVMLDDFYPSSVQQDDQSKTPNARAEVDNVGSITPTTAASKSFNPQRWIKIYQTSAAAPVFGWIRGFGRMRTETGPLGPSRDATFSFNPVAHPVPKKCRSIGGASHLRIEITAALSVPSPCGETSLQHLWLIGRCSSLQSPQVSPPRCADKNVGKVYIFDPLQLTEALVSRDLDDEFVPTSAGLFSLANPCLRSPEVVAKSGRFIVRDFRTLPVDASSEVHPSTPHRVLIASSDGRFLVCAIAPDPDAVSTSNAYKLVLLSTFRLANPGESATAMVSLHQRICLGVLNSAGSNQLVTLRWNLRTAGPPPRNDIELNQLLHTTSRGLPGAAPSGPIIMSTICEGTFFWLGTVGGGGVHCFDLTRDAFVAELSLPSQTPCLHAVAVDSRAACDSVPNSPLIWLAVSGHNPPTPQRQVTPTPLDGSVCVGPLSRLLSICSNKKAFVHNIDLTSILTSMIDMTDVVDPVDFTVSRLFVQNHDCLWFSTRCGLIGRFFTSAISNDPAVWAPNEVLSRDAISLSSHAYRRPLSALIAIRNNMEPACSDSIALTSPSDQASFLVVAVGHDYTYLRTSTPASRPGTVTSPLVDAVNQCIQRSFSGAHAIVWVVSM